MKGLSFALGFIIIGLLMWARADAASDWDQIVAAAKKEARVVVIGPEGADIRDALTTGFQKKYPEIYVDFSSLRGAEVAPKLLAELGAKQHITDLVMAGTTTALGSLVPAKAIVPMQPYLAGPSASDQSKWRGGKFNFSDEAMQYNLVFGMRVQVAFAYNPQIVSAKEFTSWKDLLNPKWNGQITMLDPRRAGAGLDLATFWYTNEQKGLGKEFIRGLFKQNVVLSNEDRQIIDFAARGKRAIAIGPSGVLLFELKRTGIPIDMFGSAALKEGGFVTASNGTISVVRDLPHVNAAKVYLDWLFSQEGQALWSKASGLASLRRDVPRDHIPDLLVPKEGVQYQENFAERYVKMRSEIVGFLKTVLPR